MKTHRLTTEQGCAHSWTQHAQPCPSDPTAHGVPSPRQGHPNMESSYTGFPESPLYTKPTEACGKTFQMGSLHNFQRGGPTWLGCFLPQPPPTSRKPSSFPKSGRRVPQGAPFCQPALHKAQFPNVPKCFSKAPATKRTKTQYK